MSAARVVMSIRSPTQPSSAGSSVNDTSTISTTPTAAARATAVTNSSPINVSPISEMTTVVPAKITARPLVSIASTTESSTESPACNASR